MRELYWLGDGMGVVGTVGGQVLLSFAWLVIVKGGLDPALMGWQQKKQKNAGAGQRKHQASQNKRPP